MAYDLRYEPWIPMRRRSGRVEWMPPSGITNPGDGDPVVALACPRPEFDAAVLEFLIGLATVAMDVDDEDEWYMWWKGPPTPAQLQERLRALPDAFFLAGDGPRFLQDIDDAAFADVDASRVEQLLIHAPGDQTLRQNGDLFVKRGQVECLARPAAAMALLTLQTYAPSGGQGHRTSMRGGGPLTTLGVVRRRPNETPSLWDVIWANAETRAQWSRRTPQLKEDTTVGRFPWMGPTRVSDKDRGTVTTPADVHPLQAYFGMPRRIRLQFGGEGTCSLTGERDTTTVTGFTMRNFGVNYEGWRHPLSPYYRQKAATELLPVHRQVGALVWRDWLGMTLGTPGGMREPALTVAHLIQHRLSLIGEAEVRVSACGFDMDNMKARGWVEARMPAFSATDAAIREAAIDVAARLAEGTATAEFSLIRAVEGALYERSDDARGDRGHVRAALWHGTEEAFLAVLRQVSEGLEASERDATVQQFRRDVLEPATLAVFDEGVVGLGSDPVALRRVVRMRYGLQGTLRGHGKDGEKLFKALRLPLSVTNASRKRKEKAK